MAHYQAIDRSRRFIAVDLERQSLPGTFEQALDHPALHDDLTLHSRLSPFVVMLRQAQQRVRLRRIEP
jgi:hypothetical protein